MRRGMSLNVAVVNMARRFTTMSKVNGLDTEICPVVAAGAELIFQLR